MKLEDYGKYYIQNSEHYLIPKAIFIELYEEMANFREETSELKSQLKGTTHCFDEEEHEQLRRENQKLKSQIDYALKLLSENNLPCDIDNFTDKHSDYCLMNCGVDEEVFKRCWLLYINDKLKEME